MVQKSEEANTLVKWRFLIWLKKRLLENWVFSFYSERTFKDAEKANSMPYWLLKLPKDIDKGLYDERPY